MEVSGVATYLYNGLQQRVAKNVGGVLSHYAYNEKSRLIGEYNATGQAVNETVYLFGQPVAVLKGTEVFNVHADHLGSPRKISNQAGAVVWAWPEQPFGDVAANQDPDNDGVAFEYNLRFPGQFFDRETGLYYNFHRYYDAQTGRYITSDPIGLAGGLNTFGYVGGNPLRFTDLTGRCPWCVVVGVTAVATGVVAAIHWTRNIWNEDVSFSDAQKYWQELPAEKSIYHKMGDGNEGNRKFVSPDGGHSEAVFTADGCPVTDPKNQATYNFFGPEYLGGIPHGVTDVLPYFIFGNTPGDMFTTDRFITTWGALNK